MLFELGAGGLEERDSETHPADVAPGLVVLVASFTGRADAERALGDARASAPDVAWELGEVVGDAWRDQYKEHFAPFALTRSIILAPPWVERPPTAAGQQLLWMDPGRAFGTGLHATTSLCAEYLEDHRSELASSTVLDVGTGSGILGLVALLLGASRALAIDTDLDALEVARENADRNPAAADRLEIAATPLAGVSGSFPWVVANIEARTLVALAPALWAHVAPGGRLVLSGVLSDQTEDVASAFTRLGASLVDVRSRGDGADAWTVLVLEARGRG